MANETAALEKMPKGRLEYLRRLLPHLQNQSEDCLYLNIYVPIQGKIFIFFVLNFIESCFENKALATIKTINNYGINFELKWHIKRILFIPISAIAV